ncbi:nuclear transport factor 2 family protein [Amycolatopsis sp. cg5]|uniref:nuclear transport factor 2 family protein n=1 Tax=Amycolatopsis sp. cg5 TaxID=3238802 RepID=UPI003523BA33
MDLVALEELKRLKYRYLRSLDLKRWAEFETTLAPDATADYGEQLRFGSRAEIVKFMRTWLESDIITVHHCHHPELEIDGSTATGSWCLDDTIIVPEHRLMIRGSAFYEDVYVLGDDGWRIARTGYQRTYESTMSLDDMPSFKLTANRWAAG